MFEAVSSVTDTEGGHGGHAGSVPRFTNHPYLYPNANFAGEIGNIFAMHEI